MKNKSDTSTELIPAPSDLSYTTPAEMERLFHELNLLRLEGYIFDFAKKHSTRGDERQVFSETLKLPTGKILENQTITIEPSRYGKPRDIAYKIFQATLKKLSDEGWEYATHVAFSQREMQRMTGRKSWGGKDSEAYLAAVKQLRHTGIECTLYDKTTQEAITADFNLFSTAYLSSKKQKVTKCVFEVNSYILRSLRSKYAFLLNYDRLMQLKDPIAMALFKHIFDNFRRLHSLDTNRPFVFKKKYEKVIAEWFGGGLAIHTYKAHILGKQFGGHFQTLKKIGLVSSITIEVAEEGGFNIVARPGAGFFQDYQDLYLHKQLKLPFRQAADENLLGQPLKLVAYFHMKRLGVKDLEDMVFGDKEVTVAEEMLAVLSETEGHEFVDYSLSKARQSNYEPQTIAGIRQYLNGFKATQKDRDRWRQAEERKLGAARAERAKEAYGRFKKTELERIRSGISPEEMDALQSTVAAEVAEKHGSNSIGFGTLVRLGVDELILERYPVAAFEVWQKTLGTSAPGQIPSRPLVNASGIQA